MYNNLRYNKFLLPNAGISKTINKAFKMSSFELLSLLNCSSICKLPASVTRALTRAFSKMQLCNLNRAVYALLTAGRSTGIFLPPSLSVGVCTQESSSLSFSPSSERTSSFFKPVKLPKGRIRKLHKNG